MNELKIEATDDCPSIHFDPKSCQLDIRGNSYPENAMKFYDPVLSWLEDYLEGDISSIRANIELTYFNSSSSKIFLDFFDMLNDAAEEGLNVEVNWYYRKEDEMTLEYGEEFKEDLEGLKFNLVEKD